MRSYLRCVHLKCVCHDSSSQTCVDKRVCDDGTCTSTHLAPRLHVPAGTEKGAAIEVHRTVSERLKPSYLERVRQDLVCSCLSFLIKF
jgi:hypothetical protein